MDNSENLRFTRESTWRMLRKSRRTRLTIAWSITALFAFATYELAQAEAGSISAKTWGAVGLCSAISCFLAFGTVGEVNERIWATTNADGRFILEALSPDGNRTQSNVEQSIRPLVETIATTLKKGGRLPDNVRSEALRIAELALNETANVEYPKTRKINRLLSWRDHN